MGALTPDGVGEAGGAVDTEGGADSGALELFHPRIREWFRDEVGTPTDVQSLAWPRIAAGEHVLVSAPTGSGKTLTAFLWALDRLFTGAWRPGRVRVLYVSPLRALNTDIRRNLTGPLDALRQRFEAADEPAPRLRAMTRSGDTPQNERRRMLRHPPEILVTTPESLNILLTSDSGRALLEGVEAVILDEIHALAGSKRGTHLITAVDRLVPLAGEFQRIALSATVRPMETVAELVAGHELIEGAATAGEAVYRPRRMSIVRAPGSKTYDVKVRYVADPDPEKEVEDDSVWAGLTRDFRRVIRRNRSTLLFANSRRSTEKITRFVNSAEGEELAYSHHGSLSREVRSVVEKRLKEGQLKAIVATNSLELGIDIGALDEVLLVQTPRAVSSAIQRVGRAGHGVGEVSRGVFYPTHGLDLLDAAVVARCVSRQEIEEVRPISGALDVLAQVILSMVSVQEWNVDELYDRVRASHPYRHLSRRHFDLVIEMLAGRYADSRVRELRPRLTYDRVKGGVKARPGTRRLLYMSGGTIADRGYFALRHQDTMAKIGDLDEEFVWERSVGDAFTLGAQSWQIRRITHNDVLVTPGRGPQAALAPFWRADAQDRGHFLCQETAAFLERAEGRLADSTFLDVLEEEYRLERPAAEALVEYLEEQRAATGGKLPRRDRLLVEHCGERFGASGSRAVILHTFWGGTVNRPLAMVLAAAWEERHGEPLEAFHDDHCLLVRLPGDLTIEELFAMAPPDQVEQLLRRRLESTGFFGARFRWAASTSLLLPKSGFRQRMPLWMNRQRSKKLQDSVQGYGDFPMLVETWRTCLYDELDLDQLKRQVGRVRDGELPLDHVSSGKPSPFAANLVWQHTNKYMYEDDTPDPGAAPGRASGLRQDVLQELVYASHLRPRLPVELVESFRRKVQRISPGYAPRPGEDLGHWLGERLLLSGSEWRELVAAVAADAEIPAPEVAESTPVLTLRLPGAAESAVAAPEGAARVLRALGLEIDGVVLGHVDGVREAPSEAVSSLRALVDLGPVAADAGAGDDERAAAVAGLVAGLVAEWLRYHGPVTTAWAAALWGLEDDQLPELLDTLAETRSAVVDQMTLGTSEAEVCDAENLEILLRWLRMDRRPSFEARPAAELPLFLASRQGLVRRGDGVEDLQDRLERLFGLSLKAQLWETEVLPARLDPYFPSWLDAAMQQSELTWLGTGSERATFGFDSDLDLFYDPSDGPGAEQAVGEARDEAEALGRLFVD
ncbi:MAG: DEAD/DEAH box helicase, partial [Acidobacteriota bacterium]